MVVLCWYNPDAHFAHFASPSVFTLSQSSKGGIHPVEIVQDCRLLLMMVGDGVKGVEGDRWFLAQTYFVCIRRMMWNVWAGVWVVFL